MHRPVQFDHVPGHLHADPGAVERERGGDFGLPLHRDHRWSGDPAVGRCGVRIGRLCDGFGRAGTLLRLALPVLVGRCEGADPSVPLKVARASCA